MRKILLVLVALVAMFAVGGMVGFDVQPTIKTAFDDWDLAEVMAGDPRYAVVQDVESKFPFMYIVTVIPRERAGEVADVTVHIFADPDVMQEMEREEFYAAMMGTQAETVISVARNFESATRITIFWVELVPVQILGDSGFIAPVYVGFSGPTDTFLAWATAEPTVESLTQLTDTDKIQVYMQLPWSRPLYCPDALPRPSIESVPWESCPCYE